MPFFVRTKETPPKKIPEFRLIFSIATQPAEVNGAQIAILWKGPVGANNYSPLQKPREASPDVGPKRQEEIIGLRIR